jgi:anti-anti-sigma factor
MTSQPPFAAIPSTRVGGLRLVGELDLATVEVLRAALAELPPTSGGIWLDLSGLSFIDVSGIHALEECASALDGTGPLVVEHASAAILRVFRLLGIEQNPGIEIRGGANV